MKNGKIKYILASVVTLFALFIIVGCKNSEEPGVSGPRFFIDSSDGISVLVTMNNAEKDTGDVGYITVDEGEKLAVQCNLSTDSSVKVEFYQYNDVFPSGTEGITDPYGAIDGSIKPIDVAEFANQGRYTTEVGPGRYVVRVTVQQKATGTISVFTLNK